MTIAVNLLKTVLITAFVLLALVSVAVNIKLPLDYKLLAVKSGSMEPAIPVGSVLLTKATADFASPEPSARFSTGDVITYSAAQKNFVSHRVVDVQEKEGQFFYQTKGDANNNPDSNLAAEDSVVGKVMLSVPFLGRFPDFIKQPIGYFLMIVVPALYVIFSELASLWRELHKSKFSVTPNTSNTNFVLPTVMSFLAAFYFVGGTAAYFSDTANSTDNTFIAVDCFGEEGEVWADSVVSSSQGTKKNGSLVDANRSDPTEALGPADGSGNPVSGFFSLGFGGEIVLKFEFPVKDGAGDDLSFHEITNGRSSYPEETALVEVSKTGDTWEEVGTVSSKDDLSTGISFLDLSSTSFDSIQSVRITDTSDDSIHNNSADGYDLDAVDAVYGCVLEQQL